MILSMCFDETANDDRLTLPKGLIRKPQGHLSTSIVLVILSSHTLADTCLSWKSSVTFCPTHSQEHSSCNLILLPQHFPNWKSSASQQTWITLCKGFLI